MLSLLHKSEALTKYQMGLIMPLLPQPKEGSSLRPNPGFEIEENGM